jgi:glycosyltransferase involved in cell wall biosynthesis
LLAEAGIDAQKCAIVPLVYSPPAAAKNFTRTYPDAFSSERPLRVLFLGQVILRKGMAAVLDAITQLEGKPIEFWIVGGCQINVPETFKNHPQIRWIGRIPRSETAYYYQQADVFLFPTLSDGFGLTQLDAQAWQLPVIASQNCGKVVEDGENGWVLPEVSGSAIAACLQKLLASPHFLKQSCPNLQTTGNNVSALKAALNQLV